MDLISKLRRIPVEFYIAIVGGIAGALMGSKSYLFVGSYLPVFIYQLGLDSGSGGSGNQESQGQRGVYRFVLAAVGSLLPGICGLISGGIVGSILYYDEFN